MRILLLNVTAGMDRIGTSEVGGTERFTWRLAGALADWGHQTVLVTGEPAGEVYNPDVTVRTFACRPTASFLDIGSRYRKFRQRMNFFNGVKRYLRDERFDAVHLFKPYDFWAASWLKRHCGNPRIISRFGGLDFFPGDRFLLKHLDLLYANSADTAKRVRERYGRPVEVVHNIVERGYFNLKREPNNDAVNIVSIGRLVGWKGFQYGLEAFRLICETEKNVVYHIAGEGLERNNLAKTVESCGLGGGVRFHGLLSAGEIRDLLAASEILIHPSIGWESLPNAVCEAMAAGLPTVAAQSGGVAELVDDGETGYLVEKRDSRRMAEKTTALVRNAELRRKMGTAAREKAARLFHPDKLKPRFESLFSNRNS